MKFTFNHYAIPYPAMEKPDAVAAGYDPAVIFAPDQLLEALEMKVRPLVAGHWETYWRDVAAGASPELFLPYNERRNGVLIRETAIGWEETLAMTRKTLRRIDPGGWPMASRFDEALRCKWITAQWVAPGLGAGTCRRIAAMPGTSCPAIINFESDGTINDPAYMIHEVGHYIADARNRGREMVGRQPKAERAGMETQAFFFQHAFYDPALLPQRPPELALAIAQHKRASMLITLRAIENSFDCMERSREIRGDARLSEAGFAQLDGGYAVHADEHSAADFIAAGLWGRYKKMSTTGKSKFLDALYPVGAQFPETNGVPPLETVLAAAGVGDEKDFSAFMDEAIAAALSTCPQIKTGPEMAGPVV